MGASNPFRWVSRVAGCKSRQPGRLRCPAASPVHRAVLLTIVCAIAPSLPAMAGPVRTSVEALHRDAAPPAHTASVPAAGRNRNAALRLAVAANFRAPFDELAEKFEHRHGVTLSPTFGSSGLLAAQIRQGAPFDVFFSADTMRPRALVGDGFADAPVTVYARGRVALRKPGPAGAASRDGSLRIGIANPQLAPYGAAAMQCLNRLGVWGRIRDRLVFGNNVNQVDHFLESGALQLGFVALSQLVDKGIGPERYWVCPAAFHAPIEQGAVVLHRSGRPGAARTLLRFMTAPGTQARLARLGYLHGD